MIFTTEAEWEAAYAAAKAELEFAVESGQMECPRATLGVLASKVATAAIRSALDVAPDDISSVPGIHVERITIQRIPESLAS